MYKITRTPRKGDAPMEFLLAGRNPDWTTDEKRAVEFSEEDARAWVRVLTSQEAKLPEYVYDYTAASG